MSIEFTDDPHPRNVYWEMWGLPMFDLEDAAGAVYELNRCREAYPNHYIRLNAYDASRAANHGAAVHRQPSSGRARLPPGAPGEPRPHAALHAAPLRRRAAPRSAVPGRQRGRAHGGVRREAGFQQEAHASYDEVVEVVEVEGIIRDANIDDVLARLDRELVALRVVKQRVAEVASLLLVDRIRRTLGLEAEPPTLHMSFTGNPGTGKTTVVERMVEMLLQVMENQRTGLVVIMAGYADRMDRFFSDVPGLSSRIGHDIDFPDYSAEELMDIAELMSREQQYVFSPEGKEAFKSTWSAAWNSPGSPTPAASATPSTGSACATPSGCGKRRPMRAEADQGGSGDDPSRGCAQEPRLDEEVALNYGARWEDDELVTYDMKTLKLVVANEGDDFLKDND